MRAFIVLCFLATTVRANVAGYTYQAAGQAVSLGNSAADIGSNSNYGQVSGFSNNAGGSSLGHGGSIGSFGGLSQTASGHSTHHGATQEQYIAPVQNEFTKEFYTFEAPQEDTQDAQHLERIASSLKKNFQIIFIKGPENHGLEHAALSLAKSATDSRTAIYVLQKQTDLSSLANNLSNLHTHNANTPEVHFVKYRTPADAANAQHAIQSQYDSLGGASVHKNGGVAQVLNFASNYAPAYHGSGYSVGHDSRYSTGEGISTSSGSGSGGVSAPSQAYLPVSF